MIFGMKKEKGNYEENIKVSLYRQYSHEVTDEKEKSKDLSKPYLEAIAEDAGKEKGKDDPKDLPPPVPYYKLYSDVYDRILMFVGAAAGLGTGLCQPANTIIFGDLTGTMVDKAGKLNQENATLAQVTELRQEFLDAINDFAIGNSVLGAIMMVLTYISITTFNYSAQRQIFRIRRLYLQAALRQDISWYDTNQTGDFASRMTEEVGGGIGRESGHVLPFPSGIHRLVGSGACQRMGTRPHMPHILSGHHDLCWCDCKGSIAEEVLSSVRTVIAYGGQDKESERYSTNLVYARDNNIKRSFFSGLGMGILWFCIYASYALAFWYGIGLVLKGRKDPTEAQYDASTMVTVFFGVMMGSMNFGQSSTYFETFAVAKGSAGKIFSVLGRIPPIDSMSNEGEKPKTIEGILSFEDVHFNYPSRTEVKILNGLNLNINRGQTVALVGSSGCGKSTCIQLIQRFYDPLKGTVKLDGRDLKTLNTNWLRKHIGVVGQEPVLFGYTIAENIRLGREEVSDEEIQKAAKQANAHDFIMKLPQKYDTLVGERGAQISGGQKQRIAIARALVRNPSILLLDEATSALDTGSEAKVQEALDKASKGRTTVIVAHRLSTIRGADKIVVVHEGKVVEEGNHSELMAKGGHYFELVNAQLNSGDEGENNEESSTETEEKDKEEPTISMFEIIKMNKPEWPYILAGAVTSGIMGCSMPVFAIIFGDILGVLSKPTEQEVRDGSNIYNIFFVITGVVVGLATVIQMYSFGVAGEKLTMRIRSMSFSAMLRQEIAWFDDKENNTGSLCARLSGEAASVQGATGSRIGTILQSVATVVLALALSLYYEWRLGLVALSFCPVIMVTTFFQRRVLMNESLSMKAGIEKSSKLAVEAVGNIRTVAGLGAEPTFISLYVHELEGPHKLALRNTHFRGLVFAIARSIIFFAYATCMYYGGQLIANENLDYAKVFKVSQALIMGTFSVANALAFAPNFQKGLLAADRIFKMCARMPQITDPRFPTGPWQVKFFYPTRSTVNVLKGLSMSVKKGQTVALVGASGCGKSTCIQLLERFYDPNLDDRDISTVALRDLRNQMGIVSQEPVLFDRTIAENIAYGDNSREVLMGEIIEAAKMANIHSFIINLPQGYETRLGEKGTQLSGGQKQRVAIARALVRNPKLLLLDEATSALDVESEKVVQEALDKAKKGRTCVMIAHRLSTVVDSDVIFVIDNGRVSEMGTHQQLLGRKGIYHRLYTLQSGGGSS
ncbi:hypothetical protein J437_LFUL001427 [Ladona fulva]|uniref:ABC-type xenobiotic transporter n=1 Tax=Ladona fulva TaxID=123851 RepID=A0A8K0NWF8_LADFU|nr:hypothetical protein J437_LFUL001427 [Ladona fulva]